MFYPVHKLWLIEVLFILEYGNIPIYLKLLRQTERNDERYECHSDYGTEKSGIYS